MPRDLLDTYEEHGWWRDLRAVFVTRSNLPPREVDALPIAVAMPFVH